MIFPKVSGLGQWYGLKIVPGNYTEMVVLVKCVVHTKEYVESSKVRKNKRKLR